MTPANRTLADLPDGAAFDVAVLGAGAAGMAAAVFAAVDGARVLLVERTEHVGGTSAYSAATAWIPNTRHAEAIGADDSLEKARGFLNRVVGNRSPSAMRDAFLEAGPAAIDTLEDRAGVHFRARPFHPDYLHEVEGSTSFGRALEPLPFDASILGDDLQLIRPTIPEFTILGGLLVDRDDIAHLLKMTSSLKSLAYSMRLIGSYYVQKARHGRGTRLVMGNALIGQLLAAARRHGVTIATETDVTAFNGPEHAVTGVTLRQNGLERSVTVAGGVILASGGFTRHPTRRGEMLPAPLAANSPSAPGHTGALHDLALAKGAVYGTGAASNVYWAPCSVRKRPDGTTAVFPHFVLDRSKPGTLAVGRDGRRFTNESRSYHEFTLAMYAANRDGSHMPVFLVADAGTLAKYGLGMVRPGGKGLQPYLDDGYLVQGATLGELAGKLGIDAAGLEETAARMNRFAETGKDEDFHRGETVYERGNGDATHVPNPTLGPVRTAPFYAVRLEPGDIGAATGLSCDTNARVLDGEGRPIDGLYACGNDMQSIMGGVYPGPGITIGPGMTFGYLAARHARARAQSAGGGSAHAAA
ncbi:FAD-binding dehydrogenase [Zhengella mangrovi]|uniref:FAD-binding dehydrogenase n=1 Tax=Zhengella mangrovi TaxID=1982044 RepID=A0A2G1QNE5_9HYPH|nr:FAD-dependent oxidoreductase [Zhengella mangrovi]PHP66728.1 FAD-binding dehydrogenase [Zhengella mangrovi]